MFTGVLGNDDSQLGAFQLGEIGGPQTFIENITQTLTLSQSAGREIHLTISQTLTITESASRATSVILGVENTFSITRNLAAVLVLSGGGSLFLREIIQNLGFSHIAFTDFAFNRGAIENLTLTQLVTLGIVKTVKVIQNLVISQQVQRRMSYNLALSQNIQFRNGTTKLLPIFSQGPNGGQHQVVYDDRQATAVVTNHQNRYLTLEVPGQIVVLRTPQLNDSMNYTGEVDLKKSMTGVIYTYVKRPKLTTLKYEFFLGRQKSLELEQFLADHSSETIILKNWKGEVWVGNIINSPFEFTTNARYLNESERVDVPIEFTGVMVTGNASNSCGGF